MMYIQNPAWHPQAPRGYKRPRNHPWQVPTSNAAAQGATASGTTYQFGLQGEQDQNATGTSYSSPPQPNPPPTAQDPMNKGGLPNPFPYGFSNPASPAQNLLDPLGLFGGGGNGMGFRQSMDWLLRDMPKRPAWWDVSKYGKWQDWLGQNWRPGSTGWRDTLRWMHTPTDMGALNAASKDPNSPFYGVNWDALPEWYSRKAWAALTPGNPNQIKDPLMLTTMGQLGQALSSNPLYTSNDVRNQTLDARQGINRDWEATQRQMEDAGAGRGIVDSGVYGRTVGEGLANRDAAVQSTLLENVQNAAQANYQYKQGLLDRAMQNLQMLTQQKRANRRQKEAWLNQLMSMNAQGQAQNQAGLYGALGSLGSSLGSALASR